MLYFSFNWLWRKHFLFFSLQCIRKPKIQEFQKGARGANSEIPDNCRTQRKTGEADSKWHRERDEGDGTNGGFHAVRHGAGSSWEETQNE